VRVRILALLLACSTAALADEVDLSEQSGGRTPQFVLRAEGGTDFAPYGLAGATVSWLTESQFAFELGAGAGFPGLQLGFAARRLFGDYGSFFVTEIAIAGNTRVNRGASSADRYLNAGATAGRGSVWTNLGIGFEQRSDAIDFSLVGCLVLTTASLTPHFAVHGGVGFGF
jgi:hypothetical protein